MMILFGDIKFELFKTLQCMCHLKHKTKNLLWKSIDATKLINLHGNIYGLVLIIKYDYKRQTRELKNRHLSAKIPSMNLIDDNDNDVITKYDLSTIQAFTT
jgi:hypothetical protein